MQERQLDPKYGRWALPLVVFAMVAFTWIFVNALDPGSPSAGPSGSVKTTTTKPGTTTTAAPTTLPPPTTTLPAAVVAYATDIASRKAAVDEFLTRADQINADWDNKEATGLEFKVARQQLRDLRDEIIAFRDQFKTVVVPAEAPALGPLHVEMGPPADALANAASRIVDGIESSDKGEIRHAALEDFRTQATAFVTAAQRVLEAQPLPAA